MGKSPWSRLQQREQRALTAAWDSDVPPLASAIHARWWQLESWLRSLVYVELRARFGAHWSDHLPATADKLRAKDAESQRYMSTADASQQLNYLDVGQLFELIDEQWDLFASSLVDQRAWRGRVDELNKIRRRIAHCRRPHSDDLARLEQTLRDLDPGAHNAMATFNGQEVPDSDLNDPLVEQWMRGGHSDADIVVHADRQYDTRFVLRYSRRPWAKPVQDGAPISGSAGYLWHANWIGAHVNNVGAWWRDSYFDVARWRDLIVYACLDMYSVSLSFAACDDPLAIADGIGHCFQATLERHPRVVNDLTKLDEELERWRGTARDLDPRIQVGTGWNYLTFDTVPVTVFSA